MCMLVCDFIVRMQKGFLPIIFICLSIVMLYVNGSQKDIVFIQANNISMKSNIFRMRQTYAYHYAWQCLRSINALIISRDNGVQNHLLSSVENRCFAVFSIQDTLQSIQTYTLESPWSIVEPQNAPYTICSLEVHIVYPAYTIWSP